MANTNTTKLTKSLIGKMVRTWRGEIGQVQYIKGAWYGVIIRGERAATEWLPETLTAA